MSTGTNKRDKGMKLSGWRLCLFAFICSWYAGLDTWFVIERGWYESLAILMFTPIFILFGFIACLGLEENLVKRATKF